MNLEILPQLLVNALIGGSIYALASSGLALTYGLLRVLNFAHGHLLMAGAYSFYFFHIAMGLDIVSASAASIAFTSAMAWLALQVFVLPFLELNSLLTLVSTLALANLLEAGVSIKFGVNVRSLVIGDLPESYDFYGVYITFSQLIILASAAIILGVVAAVLKYFPIGRQIRAMSENSNLSETLGTNARKIRLLVYIFGSLLASFAGVLIGYETNLQPTMGATYTVKAFAAMILGGLGSFGGTIAGSYLLSMIENLAIGLDFGGWGIPAGYKDGFAFAIILVLLLFRPEGLFRKKLRAV